MKKSDNGKTDVGVMFDGIAQTYDRLNHLLSLDIDKVWRRKAVKMLRKAGELLDVAAGTADLSLEIVRSDKAVHVTGMDISTGMMEIGRRKVAKLSLDDRISFVEGSALQMPFDSDSFDAVSCAYGVRNFSDLDKGLSEMYRVLRPGGQLMILEFSYPSNRIVRVLYDFYFSKLMPLAGKLVSGNGGAYKYLRDSVKGFIWGEEMVERISACGFRNISFRTLSFGITTIYLAEK